MKIAEDSCRLEKRHHPRTPYSGHIFFATEPLEVEEVLTIALPFSDDRQCKYKGQVVWRNDEGIGVELFKKRTNANMRIIK